MKPICAWLILGVSNGGNCRMSSIQFTILPVRKSSKTMLSAFGEPNIPARKEWQSKSLPMACLGLSFNTTTGGLLLNRSSPIRGAPPTHLPSFSMDQAQSQVSCMTKRIVYDDARDFQAARPPNTPSSLSQKVADFYHEQAGYSYV